MVTTQSNRKADPFPVATNPVVMAGVPRRPIFSSLPAAALGAGLVLMTLQTLAARHASYYGQDVLSVWKAEHNFLHGLPVFTQDPHSLPYIYPPSSTALIAPLGWLSLTAAKLTVLIVSSIALVAAAGVSVIVVSERRPPARLAWILPALAIVEPTVDALSNLNLTVVIALFVPVCLWCWRRDHDLAAAMLLGLSLAIKPLLVPLLLVLLLRRRPLLVLVALVPPILGSLAVLPLLNDPGSFFTDVIPKLLSSSAGRLGPHNISIAGLGHTFGWPAALTILLRIAVAVVACRIAWRDWNSGLNEVHKLTLTSGALLLGWLLADAVAEPHYELLLLPLFALLITEPRLVHGWLAGVGAALFLTTLRLPIISGTENDSRGLWQAAGLFVFLLAFLRSPRDSQNTRYAPGLSATTPGLV